MTTENENENETTDPAAATESVTETETEPEESAVEPSRREARYRRQLRDVEAERDGLAGRVESMQRAEVERIAGQILDVPGGLWAGGVTVDQVLDESGDVDEAKVTAAATAALEKLGLRPVHRPPNPDPAQGQETTAGPAVPSFVSAFGPQR